MNVPMEVPLIGQQQVSFACAENEGHLASPVVMPVLLNGPNNAKVVMSFGGLTKLEALAGQICTGFVDTQEYSPTADKEEIAVMATDLAEAVLAECARRQPQLHQNAQ